MPENKFKELFQRLNVLIQDICGGNQSEFAKRIGVPQSTFIGYLNESGQNKVKFSVLIRIIEVFDISPDWLMTGLGAMFRQARQDGNVVAAPNEPKAFDPIAHRIETVERLLRQSGATDAEIREAIMAALRAGDAAQSEKERTSGAG